MVRAAGAVEQAFDGARRTGFHLMEPQRQALHPDPDTDRCGEAPFSFTGGIAG